MSRPHSQRVREAASLPHRDRGDPLLVSAIVLAGVGLVLFGLGLYLLVLRPGFVLLPEDVRYTRLTPEQLRAAHRPLFDWMGLVFRSWVPS